MIVELHEFGLQELKIDEMEAEASLVYLTFKERERIWGAEMVEVGFHMNLIRKTCCFQYFRSKNLCRKLLGY